MKGKKAQVWLGVVITLVIIIIISGGLVFKFWLGPKIFFKQVDAAHDIVDKTYDADNAIYNYEWFKTQYEKIGAAERQIDNTGIQVDDYKEMYGDPKEWDWTTKEEYNRLQQSLKESFIQHKNQSNSLNI